MTQTNDTPREPAKVFFADLRARAANKNRTAKLKKLFEAVGCENIVAKGDLTAVKLHFGERGCDTHISPTHARAVVERIKALGGRPFVTDTNTLYSGSRHNAVDHIATAVEHGFDYAVLGAPVVIADGLDSTNVIEVEIAGKHFTRVKIAGDIVRADSLVVLSHFKGHELAGFGGAVKNLAMGCAPGPASRTSTASALPWMPKSASAAANAWPSARSARPPWPTGRRPSTSPRASAAASA